jgi:hypothetical protein
MPNLEKLLLKSFTSISSFHICTVDAAGCGGTAISKKLKNRFLQFTRQFILAVYFFFLHRETYTVRKTRLAWQACMGVSQNAERFNYLRIA